MSFSNIFIMLIIFSSVLMVLKATRFPCPESCRCWDIGKNPSHPVGLWIQCKGGTRSTVPEVDPSVTFFDLSGGNYPVLDAKTFRATQNIQNLYLNGSKIQTIERSTFSGLQNLAFLSLAENKLTTIQLDGFRKLRSDNLRVNLSGNPWHCDCKLWRSLTSLSKVLYFSWQDVVCHTPEKYHQSQIKIIGFLSKCENEKVEPQRLLDVIFLCVYILLLVLVAAASAIIYFSFLKREKNVFDVPTAEKRMYAKIQKQPLAEVPKQILDYDFGHHQEEPIHGNSPSNNDFFISRSARDRDSQQSFPGKQRTYSCGEASLPQLRVNYQKPFNRSFSYNPDNLNSTGIQQNVGHRQFAWPNQPSSFLQRRETQI